MLKAAEHKIFNRKISRIQHFQAQISLQCYFLLINVKPTIPGILILMSRKITCSAELSMKYFITSGPEFGSFRSALFPLREAVCVYSNSRNDVPRVAQRYETIAAHTRRRASVLVVFVVFCVHMHSFAGLIRRTLPPTFSDTAITDRHSDTTIFQLRAHWVRISWSIGSEKSIGHVPPVGVEPSTSCVQGEHPIH